MEYLKKEDFFLINYKTIKLHGGNYVSPYNLLNESPLDYLVEMVNAEIFGKVLYPEIYQKAGFYMYSVINNHVFHDGNKRTGLGAALLFLKLNHFKLQDSLQKLITDTRYTIPQIGNTNVEILIEFTLEVASVKLTLEQCQAWFELNITPT